MYAYTFMYYSPLCQMKAYREKGNNTEIINEKQEAPTVIFLYHAQMHAEIGSHTIFLVLLS